MQDLFGTCLPVKHVSRRSSISRLRSLLDGYRRHQSSSLYHRHHRECCQLNLKEKKKKDKKEARYNRKCNVCACCARCSENLLGDLVVFLYIPIYVYIRDANFFSLAIYDQSSDRYHLSRDSFFSRVFARQFLRVSTIECWTLDERRNIYN